MVVFIIYRPSKVTAHEFFVVVLFPYSNARVLLKRTHQLLSNSKQTRYFYEKRLPCTYKTHSHVIQCLWLAVLPTLTWHTASTTQFCQYSRDTLPLSSVLPTLTWYTAPVLSSANSRDTLPLPCSSANTHEIHCFCSAVPPTLTWYTAYALSSANTHVIHCLCYAVLPEITWYTARSLHFCQHSCDRLPLTSVLPILTWYTSSAMQFCQHSRDTLLLPCSSANTHKVVDSQFISPVISWVLTSYFWWLIFVQNLFFRLVKNFLRYLPQIHWLCGKHK